MYVGFVVLEFDGFVEVLTRVRGLDFVSLLGLYSYDLLVFTGV